MSKFLKEVACFLYDKYEEDIANLNIVFPNRRAGVFFQKYLSEILQRPMFSPVIYTISELVGDISNLYSADRNQLVVELYKVFKSITGTNETLDDFYYWGEMLLADFNDVDKYLIDINQLFSNIKSLKEIDYGIDYLTEEQKEFLSRFWDNILTARLSDDKTQFLSIWEKLVPIYEQFQKVLQKRGIAYEGMMYRSMVNDLSDFCDANDKTYVFVGFNALNACERKLFKQLKERNSALFFWDYDTYYTDARFHEAALFVRENISDYPMPNDFNVNYSNFTQLDNIDVVSITGFSGQATYAANWLDENRSIISPRFDNTALVLCDESLLMPMLGCVPESVEELNITMGFPIKNLPAYALVKALVDIDKSSRGKDSGELVFYYKNVLSLLSNPLLKNYLGNLFDELVDKIKNENRIYLVQSDFKDDELLTKIFNLPEKASDSKEYLQGILTILFENSDTEDNILRESLYQLHLALNKLHDSVFVADESFGELFSKKLYYQLMLRQLDRLTIPFEGEPLSGVQLMGFLETRCLDFDNVILLSFNDDKLPGKTHQHSFIPYSLRKGFGLPVLEQRNAMYAYYFYRLIQRANNVALVYDSRVDGMSAGEVSRYYTQLKYEALHLQINEKQAVFNFSPIDDEVIRIEKNDVVLAEVRNYLTKRDVSPSALNVYLNCSLKFYFKYIENIKESDDVAEDIDHLIFGRVAHKVLEDIYADFQGKEIQKEDIDAILKNEKFLNECLDKALKEEYFKKGNFSLNGKNLLVYDIIRKYVLQILKHDKASAPFKLLSLEEKYVSTIELENEGKKLAVKYGGYIDRLDLIDGKIRVVDYKTGKSDVAVTSIDKLFWAKSNRNKAAFQTMIYAGCVYENLHPVEPIVPAVYGARGVFVEGFSPFFQLKEGGMLIYQANAEEFRIEMRNLFNEILNPDIPFEMVENKNDCSFCEFRKICNREGF